MKWLSSGLRVSLSKVFLGLIMLAFVKSGALLLLGGLPILAPQLLPQSSPSLALVEPEQESITVALQAMQSAIAQASAQAAQAAESSKEEAAKKENTVAVAHLVSVYANMKPKQAAQVLETLEDNLAVKILAGMNGRTAGKILSYVKPARAAGLSEKLTRLQIPFAD